MTLRVTALGPARAGLSRASEMIDQIKKLQRAITIIITDTEHGRYSPPSVLPRVQATRAATAPDRLHSRC
jgi:hypothetical protein